MTKEMILDLGELTYFFMENNEDVEPFKSYEIIKVVDIDGNSNATEQTVSIEVEVLR